MTSIIDNWILNHVSELIVLCCIGILFVCCFLNFILRQIICWTSGIWQLSQAIYLCPYNWTQHSANIYLCQFLMANPLWLDRHKPGLIRNIKPQKDQRFSLFTLTTEVWVSYVIVSICLDNCSPSIFLYPHKHNTKDGHQTTREEKKRGRKEKRPTKQTQNN